MKPFRHDLVKLLFGLTVCLLPLSAPVSGFAEEDPTLFMAGFSAYQRKEYHDAAERLKRLLEVYPETPPRDMTLFFLARTQVGGSGTSFPRTRLALGKRGFSSGGFLSLTLTLDCGQRTLSAP